MDKKIKKVKQYRQMLDELLDMKIISLADYYKINSKLLNCFENNDAKTLDKKNKK